ncbi:membrane lipoprotein lipid attachment site-containing protein [Ornithinibacillus scapharcae]|uniref:membrane lipoprotein lipid attachment site-containing protein n=1 Tax=Ornithinibacillus scapharcae TaxID=1147159 RepID=UPI000225B54E|nr:membrane lipoprotein lipid attachment site-containing protein [Ornithinibacillus scapharcae]
MRKVLFILCIVFFLTACGNDTDERQESKANTNSDVYANFQNIDIEIKDNQALVTGEVDVWDDTFFYQVEQNENILLEEQQVEVEGKWGEFNLTIELPEELEEVLIVKMYTKGKDGSIINPNYIPIDVN